MVVVVGAVAAAAWGSETFENAPKGKVFLSGWNEQRSLVRENFCFFSCCYYCCCYCLCPCHLLVLVLKTTTVLLSSASSLCVFVQPFQEFLFSWHQPPPPTTKVAAAVIEAAPTQIILGRRLRWLLLYVCTTNTQQTTLY